MVMFHNVAILHQSKLRIAWDGTDFQFVRKAMNEYKEKIDDTEESFDVRGIFHNGSSNHTVLKIVEAAVTIDKHTPKIFALWEDANKLKLEDEVTFNGNTYKVSGIQNVNEANIVAGISLEVVL